MKQWNKPFTEPKFQQILNVKPVIAEFSQTSGFDFSFWSAFVKIYSFPNLHCVNKDENI